LSGNAVVGTGSMVLVSSRKRVSPSDPMRMLGSPLLNAGEIATRPETGAPPATVAGTNVSPWSRLTCKPVTPIAKMRSSPSPYAGGSTS
jgi:hypothetical protein